MSWGCLYKVASYGGVAQLGEHLLCKQGVVGSIPIASIFAASPRKSPGCVALVAAIRHGASKPLMAMVPCP